MILKRILILIILFLIFEQIINRQLEWNGTIINRQLEWNGTILFDLRYN